LLFSRKRASHELLPKKSVSHGCGYIAKKGKIGRTPKSHKAQGKKECIKERKKLVSLKTLHSVFDIVLKQYIFYRMYEFF